MLDGNGLTGLLLALGLAVFLFLVFRAIVLWYWRINEAINLLKEINEKLGRMAGPTPAGRP